MRTNIEIDDDLMSEAMKAAGTSTKKATVAAGLRLLVRRQRMRQVRDLRGTVAWEGDLEESRLDRSA